jgi:tetratricopeptide (TPR) repeat protein
MADERAPIEHATTEVGSGERSGDRTRSRGANEPPAFVAGALLASRYRIVNFLARGGMGEVYEAEDTALHTAVALKVIASDLAADASMIARLKREILLARKVTHPNVCRLHDLGSHEEGRAPTSFLTMDLLRGETLAAYIARKGTLSAAQALPLAKQMASALDAAHAAGVVHRDFKTRNVMIVDAEAGSPRAVVMDFGIAVAAEDATLPFDTGDGRFVGTPAYMAPEQLRGEAVSPRTDVYALGLVLFEMVTGGLPFRSSTPLDALAKRLAGPPPSPRSRVPSLDGRWNEAILRCLAHAPESRFATAGEVVAALEASPARRPWRWLAVAAGAVAIAGSAAMVRARSASSPIDPHHRPSVAVLPLRNETGRGDVGWVAGALSEMLGTELSAGDRVRLVDGDRVARAMRELSLGDAVPTGDALHRLRANLGADYIVTGTYVEIDGTLRADAALADTRSGASVAKLTARGTTLDLPDVAASLGASLRAQLGGRALTATERESARAAIASTPEAIAAFSEGEDKLRSSDYVGARQAFERATRADPKYPLAHAELARTLSLLGEESRAFDEAKIAFDGSHDLSREEQLAIEARYRAAAHEYPRAAEIWHALFDFHPDDLNYGFAYVQALDNAGESAKALAVMDDLHKLPPPDGNDPRLYVHESVVADHVTDEKRALAAARAGLVEAKARGMSITEADAHLNIGESLWALDDIDNAMAEIEAARDLYEQLGEKRNLSMALAGVAGLRAQRGEPKKAIPDLERALAVARDLGDRFQIGVRLRRLGDTELEIGNVRQADAAWSEARGLFAGVHIDKDLVRLDARRGWVLLAGGDATAARLAFTDARERSNGANGQKADVLDDTLALAEIALETGDLDVAEHEARGAESQASNLDDGLNGALASLLVARVQRERGDAAGSRVTCEAALATFEKVQGALGAILAKLLLAELALDDGQTLDATARARAVVDEFHAGGWDGREASARATLARALVAGGDDRAALEALDEADKLAPEAATTQIDLAIARARITRSSSDLEAARLRAATSGFSPRAWEATLAKTTTDRGARAKVAADATAKGCLRIAKLARRAPGRAE